jgi:glycerol-3-phosphate dehydrogenase (NAD(P)+)
MKIAVLGAGGWGTTLAIVLNENGHRVDLWEYNSEYAKTISEYRENFYYLPGIKIPRRISISNNIESAVHDKDIVVVATPTQYIRKSFESISNHNFGNALIVCVSKGIEKGSLLLVSDILLDVFKRTRSSNVLCLTGPSHAEEVSRKLPTAVVCAGKDLEKAAVVQRAFSNDYFRVYTNKDIVGAEIGGALKNVIAIAAGISDGAGYGDNTKAAIMTRGINEIMNLGLRMKAKRETFFGLSGIGDLIVTCSSRHSRNRRVGEQIGQGRKLDEILKEMKMVAEGVTTTESAYELSLKLNIELPITNQVHKILFMGKDPKTATNKLMTRELRVES